MLACSGELASGKVSWVVATSSCFWHIAFTGSAGVGGSPGAWTETAVDATVEKPSASFKRKDLSLPNKVRGKFILCRRSSGS